jgi:hypothetical protein
MGHRAIGRRRLFWLAELPIAARGSMAAAVSAQEAKAIMARPTSAGVIEAAPAHFRRDFLLQGQAGAVPRDLTAFPTHQHAGLRALGVGFEGACVSAR